MDVDRQHLAAGAQALGCPLTPPQAAQLLMYRDLLAHWNKTYNLTAIRDPQQMLVHHLLDSLSVVAPLQRHTGGRPARVLDVGSGGGLPGVVLAVALPELDVTCVDTVGKKASFVRQVAAELGLNNLQARHARVETLAEPAFDLITSRAFASLADFVQLTEPLLSNSGAWLAMKGHYPADEVAQLPSQVDVFHVEQLAVPGLAAERCLVWLKRRGPTPYQAGPRLQASG